ncbi:MAG: cupin domain-containing protein [Deltaproteobacteria bacterium]|nr:cupin domain-containing protein [Deltaproteobacteria bacterium]
MSDKKNEPIIRPISDVARAEVDHARGTSIQVLLGPDDRMPNYYTRLFTIEPNGRIPEHRHDTIEHQQVVLEGEMATSLDGEQGVASAGDCVYIPAGCAHWYENRGDVPVRFICIVPATADYGTEWLEESA